MYWCTFNQTGQEPQDRQLRLTQSMQPLSTCQWANQYCTMTPEALLELCNLAQFVCLSCMICWKTYSVASGRSSMGAYLDETWSPTLEADWLCPQLFHKDCLIIPMVPKFLSNKFNMNEERSQNCQDLLCLCLAVGSQQHPSVEELWLDPWLTLANR